MADTATLQTRLDEAEAALHRLITGSQTERLEHGDTATQFTRANIAELRAYIAQLKGELGLTSSGRVAARGVVFG